MRGLPGAVSLGSLTTQTPILPQSLPRVTEPDNADAVIQALGNLARGQERGLPTYVLEQLTLQVIEASGGDKARLEAAA